MLNGGMAAMLSQKTNQGSSALPPVLSEVTYYMGTLSII